MLVDREEDSGWSPVWNGGQEVGSEKWGPGHTGSAGVIQTTWVFYVITWQDLSSRLLRLLIGGWAGGGVEPSLEVVRSGQVGRMGVAQSLHLQPCLTEGPRN